MVFILLIQAFLYNIPAGSATNQEEVMARRAARCGIAPAAPAAAAAGQYSLFPGAVLWAKKY
ncbi:hypothetical protein DCCM_3395 [Desulfocucumis palustris]|uniref:Uncharacterized protein n=1 Tax=Desulfocucumis palustris TaxID=1898651 RepID=A0A2L2XF08_9FIRM|nr:hypothetical protein DCCM_3395 [Desulfocucumis palustris]